MIPTGEFSKKLTFYFFFLFFIYIIIKNKKNKKLFSLPPLVSPTTSPFFPSSLLFFSPSDEFRSDSSPSINLRSWLWYRDRMMGKKKKKFNRFFNYNFGEIIFLIFFSIFAAFFHRPKLIFIAKFASLFFLKK